MFKLIDDKELWDKFVDDSPHGLLFHKWNFLKIMEKYTNHRLLPYGIYKGDQLICIFPLFLYKYKGLRTVLSPPPHTSVPYLGYVMSKEFDMYKQEKKDSYLNIVADGFNKEMEKISPNYISITLVSNFFDVRPFTWNKYNAEAHFTYIIDLRRQLDEIWSDIKKEVRNKIDKSSALKLKFLKSDDVSFFYETGQKRYEEQGLNYPIISKNYLEDLLKAYPECLELLFVYDSQDNIIGSNFVYKYKHIYMNWIGGVKPQATALSNQSILWESIKMAKNEGYLRLDMCGANVKNISKFKSSINPALEVYFSIYKTDTLGKLAKWGYLNCVKRRFK